MTNNAEVPKTCNNRENTKERKGKHMRIETRKQEEKKETTEEEMYEQKEDTKR